MKRYFQILVILFMLMPFTLTYAGEASFTLAWDAPTTNADGTPLTDLAGFKAYYGTVTGVYPNVIDVGNVTTFIIGGLIEGTTYFFVMTAYDTSGNESIYSSEVSSIKIDTTPPATCTGFTVIPN